MWDRCAYMETNLNSKRVDVVVKIYDKTLKNNSHINIKRFDTN